MRRNSSAAIAATATAVIVVLAVTGSALAADLGAAAAAFQLPSDPDQMVISFTERVGEVEGTDYPSLRIYADGRVVRHRAAFMTQPGDFVGQIDPEELDDLLRSLVGKGIMEFNPATVHSAKLEAQRSRSTLSYSSDPSLFEIEVNLDSYQPAGNLAAQQDFRKTVSWLGLRHDSRTFPELAAIQDLAAACRQLDALGERIERDGVRTSGNGGGS